MTTSDHAKGPEATVDVLPSTMHSDIRGSLLAMRRAAERARRTAQHTGTDLIAMRAGEVVRVAVTQKIEQ